MFYNKSSSRSKVHSLLNTHHVATMFVSCLLKFIYFVTSHVGGVLSPARRACTVCVLYNDILYPM